MKLLEEMRERGEGQDVPWLIERIPYARFLGMKAELIGDEVMTILPFEEHIIGNVNLPAVHGGAVGAMLEITATMQLIHDLSSERLPKTIDISIDYLRSAGPKTLYGRAIVTRRGRRVANVRTELWQDSRDKPVATAHGNFLLAPLGS